MAIDVASAGKAAVSAGAAQFKTFLVPIVVGTFILALIVGFFPALRKFVA